MKESFVDNVTMDTVKPGFFQAGELEDAAAFYREQGYLVVLDALCGEEVTSLQLVARLH